MNIVDLKIEEYIAKHSTQEDSLLKELTRETYLKVLMPHMISGQVQGQLLSLISTLMRPSSILEIGTFTGYATLCLAKGLAPEGRLYTIDINAELEAMCAKYFAKAGYEKQIVQMIGSAMDLIPSLDTPFDLVFIDADKINYVNYYDLVFDKVKVGGLIIADNVLWSGKIVDEKKDKDTLALDAYNKKVQADDRVENFILSVRDGLMVARKIK